MPEISQRGERMTRSAVIRELAQMAGAQRSAYLTKRKDQRPVPRERPGSSIVLCWIDEHDQVVVETADGRRFHLATIESQAHELAKLDAALQRLAESEDKDG